MLGPVGDLAGRSALWAPRRASQLHVPRERRHRTCSLRGEKLRGRLKIAVRQLALSPSFPTGEEIHVGCELRGGRALGLCAPHQREPTGLLLAIWAGDRTMSGGAQAADRACASSGVHWQALRGCSNRCLLRGLVFRISFLCNDK